MSLPRPPADRSMAEVLRRRASDTPDRRAFLFLDSNGVEGPRLSDGDLDRQASAIASALRNVAGPGERALLLFPPGLEFIPAYFGCLYAGVIAVPAYPPRPERPWEGLDALSRLIADCQPRVVLTGGNAAADIERLCRGANSLVGMHWLNTSALPASHSRCWLPEAEDPAAIAHLQYTSGSTGSSKGVVVRHGNLMHTEYLIALCSGHFETAAAGIAGVGWLPFQHDLGLVAGLLQALYVGGPLVLMSPYTLLQRPFVWLEAITRYRGHTSGGPNFAYDLCVRRISEEQKTLLDLSCWNVAGIGAEPVRSASLEAFANAFADCGFRREAFYPSYGLAEGTLLVTCRGKDRPSPVLTFSAVELTRNEAVPTLRDSGNPAGTRTLVGCGHPWLDQQVLVVDPESRKPVPSGRIGEIWVTGPSVTAGYWNRPEETRETFSAALADGTAPFLRTGDLGFFHEAELFITGRCKDLLIVRGQNHSPQEIEQTVQSLHPALRTDAGAAFQIEQNGQERIVVVQEIDRPGRRIDPRQLARTIRQAVAETHGIEVHDVLFVRNGTLPRTPSGKVRRFACKAAFEAGRLVLWRPKPAAT